MEFQTNTAHSKLTAITQRFSLELIDSAGGTTPMEAELHYDPRDPYAVTAVFMTVAGQVRWTFGRELLVDGLNEPTGDGDVHVWPCLDSDGHAVVIIELCSPDGEALVQARTEQLRSFVDRTLKAVGKGAETSLVDVDAAIASILTAETA